MNSKKASIYEYEQLKNFEKLVEVCIEEKLDILFIVGNLYGNSKPKNKTIEVVARGFRKLRSNGINIVLVPGVHDTPLYFSNDSVPHFIHEDEGVIVLFDDTNFKKGTKNITRWIFNGRIKGYNFKIFSYYSPFIDPRRFKIEFEALNDRDDSEFENSINIFIISNIFDLREVKGDIIKEILERLKNKGIDFVIINGIDLSQYKDLIPLDIDFGIIEAPHLHKSNFKYIDSKEGLLVGQLYRVEDLKKGDSKNDEIKSGDMIEEGEALYESGSIGAAGGRYKFIVEKIIPISEFELLREKIRVDGENLSNFSNIVKNKILNNSDKHKKIYRLELIGEIEREQYHEINIHSFIEIGNKYYYYFEILDKIEFANMDKEYSNIRVFSELEELVEEKVKELVDGSIEVSDNIQDEILIYKKALEKIREDWNNNDFGM